MKYYIEVLKKYAVFDGRASRKEYWMFMLWQAIIILILSIIGKQLLRIFPATGYYPITFYLIYGYYLATLTPSLAVLARRLHDTNRSAWYLLLTIVPFLYSL